MKIAFDAKRFFQNASGLGNYSRDLVRILAEFFPENEYLLLNKKKTERGQDIVRLHGVTFVPVSKGNLSRQLKMGKDAQAHHADIFHGLSGELPLLWNKGNIKKIVTIHDLIFLHFPQYYSFFDRKIHFWKFQKSAKSANRIIAISEQTKKDIIKFLKIPEEKITVIYQTCHKAFKQAHSESELSVIKDKYNLPERFILNVGTIEERKNLFSVIKAVKDSDIPVVVVGKETSYAKKIQLFLKKNKMLHQVFFLKNVSMEDLAIIYKLASVFVYPSLYEGFGIPVIEALFSKTPVITSNLSCLPEAGGKHSLYVDPRNIEDIRAKIVHLWNYPEEGKIRAERSFEFVQKFSEEKIAKELMQLYNNVLNEIVEK